MEKILVIEDNSSLNMVFEIRLSEAGYSVECVETGKDGVNKAKSNQYQLILLDYNLPDINGAEVYNILKNDVDFKKIPIIFVSAIEKNRLIKIVQDTGADGYISLPFKSKEVVEKVKEVLNRGAKF
ncbi:MAG: response regulator [bacterium]|nr:response regulator [bacterium]